MDRIVFVQSIEYEDFEKSIVRFFDENMALYNLVGEYQCGITGNVDDASISFDLKFDEIRDIEKIYSVISGQTISIYGHMYSIEAMLEADTINIKLIDMNEDGSGHD
jgi:hypothetical protein